MATLFIILLITALIVPSGLRLIRGWIQANSQPPRSQTRHHLGPRVIVALGLGLGLLAFVWSLQPVTNILAQGPVALSLTKTFSGNGTTLTVASGQQFTYFLNYSCSVSGVGDCEDVIITDTLDSNLEYLSIAGLTGGASVDTSNPPHVLIRLGTVPDGDTKVLQLNVRFRPGTLPGTQAPNVATIDASNGPPVTSDPPVVATTQGQFEMTANKRLKGDNDDGVIGDSFITTYVIEICSPDEIGGVRLTNPFIFDNLPPQAVYVGSNPMGTYLTSTHTVSWTHTSAGGTLPDVIGVGGCYETEVLVNFPSGTVISGTVVNNQAQVSGQPEDGSPSFNSGPLNHTLTLVDPFYKAAFSKISSSPSTFFEVGDTEELAGGEVTYSIGYSNRGTVTAHKATITDTIPADHTVQVIQVNVISDPVILSYQSNETTGWQAGGTFISSTLVNSNTLLASSTDTITALRWQIGDLLVGNTTWVGQFTASLDSGLAAGQVRTNCAKAGAIWNDQGTLRLASGNACASVTIIEPRALPRVKKSVSDNSVLPEEVTVFTLKAINESVAHLPVEAPITLTDLLPEEFEIVVPDGSGSYRVATAADAWYTFSSLNAGSPPTPTVTFTPNHTGDQTYVSWQWPAPYQQPPNSELSVSFTARVKKGTPPRTLDNRSFLLWGSTTTNPLGCFGDNIYTDTLDIDNDANTTETGCQSDNAPTEVEVLLSMSSEKFVFGELDTAWNKDGLTIPGGDADYRLAITNTSNVTVTNLIVYDILPFSGDVGVIDSQPRDTDWRPNLQAPIVAPPGMPLIVSYSQSQNPCRPEVLSSNPGCTNDWSTTPPVDITSVQALRFEFCDSSGCVELGADDGSGNGGVLNLTWEMVAPNGAPFDPKRAWNSFGFTAQQKGGDQLNLPPAEPNKVGIRVQAPDPNLINLGNYVWFDVYGQQNDGLQQPEETGVNGVRVEIYNAGPDGIADNGDDTIVDLNNDGEVDFRVTGPDANGAPGYYLFTNLVPGEQYYVRFFLPTTYTANSVTYSLPYTTSIADAGNDALDSDGLTFGTSITHGLYIESAVISTTSAITTDLTWDQGIWLPTDYGDAPGPYPTAAISQTNPANAARHIIVPGLYLGAGVDDELDGQPHPNAFGDDIGSGGDDEDGVTFATFTGTAAQPTAIMVLGETSSITITANVPAGQKGFLNAWIDFNGDGDWDDAGEKIATKQRINNSINLNIPIPPGATPGLTYSRFRFSTERNLTPYGAARDGEVEDYPILLLATDYGDLPDSSIGGTPNYPTQKSDNGANHLVLLTNNPTLGATVDTELNGQPSVNADGDDVNADDEDGVTFSGPLVPGEVVTVTVTASNDASGFLNAWLDFNGNGVLDDTGEQIALNQIIPAGVSIDIPVTVPLDAAQNGTTYSRFRFSSDSNLQPTGRASDGEVEDYAVPILPLDFGDLPETTYDTEYASNGPRHIIRPIINPILGSTVDNENDGQESGAADGDGADEDGVAIPPLVPGTTVTVTVTYSNPTGSNTYLNGWLDFDGDGTLDQIATDTIVPPGSGTIDIPVTVPLGATRGPAYGRFRISSDSGLTQTGLASDGEVEDYMTAIGEIDYGDLPHDGAGPLPDYPTSFADDGARHFIAPVNNPTLGLIVDDEVDGQPSAQANGDDLNADDEDGVTFSGSLVPGEVLTVTVTASAAANGVLNAWLDFNGNGILDDPGEQISLKQNIAAGTTVNIAVNVPLTATQGITTYARFRFSSDTDLSPTGLASNGEVEDYALNTLRLDYGDLPNDGGGPLPDYPTNYSDNGARHIIDPIANPVLGSTVDNETDGQPSPQADGDDSNNDDEDGIIFSGILIPAETTVITVTYNNPTGNDTYLNGWLDIDGDGTLDQIATDTIVPPGSGTLTLNVTIPITATAGEVYSRFRLSSEPGLLLTGLANDGEVEDYILTLQAARPALVLDKTVGLARIAPNQQVTYTIRITNTGNVPLNPVRVTDTLDSGLQYLAGTATPAPDTITGQELVWTDVSGGAGLAPNATLEITLLARVSSTVGTYRNVAVGTGTHPTGVITDTDEVPVLIEDPTIDLSKQITPPGVVNGVISFTIQITNTGPSNIDVLPLFDTFSGPVAYIGGSPVADTVVNSTGQLAWNDLTQHFGNLAPNQVVTIITAFRLTTDSTEFSMTNTASVSGGLDDTGNPTNDDDETVVVNTLPTAVDLLYFYSERVAEGVRLQWATAVEYDNFGFRLMRSETGDFSQASEIAFINGQGLGTANGQSYSHTDTTAQAGVDYTYWLVDVDFDGVETVHPESPASGGGGKYQLFLPLVSK